MRRRPLIVAGMAAGALWAVAVLWLGAQVAVPLFGLPAAMALGFLPPGLVLAAMIARLAQRRFFDEEAIDGGPLAGAAEIDRRVLVNTVEQIVLALCVWPALAVLLGLHGAGVIVVLGAAFLVARLAFWAGYHMSPPLRAFGFAATFYTSVAAALWALWRLAALL